MLLLVTGHSTTPSDYYISKNPGLQEHDPQVWTWLLDVEERFGKIFLATTS